MSKLSRAEYVGLMQNYFSSVMREDVDAIRACFTPDARITIYHGDNPLRQFHAAPTADQLAFSDFYGHLLQNYSVHFGNFCHFVDTEKERCSATFEPTLTPKPESEFLADGEVSLNNCNFFRFRIDKIEDMIIYYANPALGAKLGVTDGPPTVPQG